LITKIIKTYSSIYAMTLKYDHYSQQQIEHIKKLCGCEILLRK